MWFFGCVCVGGGRRVSIVEGWVGAWVGGGGGGGGVGGWGCWWVLVWWGVVGGVEGWVGAVVMGRGRGRTKFTPCKFKLVLTNIIRFFMKYIFNNNGCIELVLFHIATVININNNF